MESINVILMRKDILSLKFMQILRVFRNAIDGIVCRTMNGNTQ